MTRGCSDACKFICPEGRYFYDGACYWYESSEKLWEGADSACANTPGGHLVYINSVPERTFIEAALTHDAPSKDVWIGAKVGIDLTPPPCAERYQWADKSSLAPNAVAVWDAAASEPHCGFNLHADVYLYINSDKKWADDHGLAVHPSLCEAPVP